MSFARLVKLVSYSVALAVLPAATVTTAQTIELKLSHFIPPNHTFHKWAVNWAEQLAKESKGRLKITIYPNGQLVGPPNRQFDAARNGIVDMSFVLHTVTPGRYPMTELAQLAFTWPKAGSNSEVTSKRLSELAPTYLAGEHAGLHILWMAVANPVVIYSRSPLQKLSDFKGVKIRFSGAQNRQTLDVMGAVPLFIAPPESQDALAKGIIDGAAFPHEGAFSLDLASVVKHVTEPGFGAAPFALVMNPAKYRSLPPDLRALIDKGSGPAVAQHFGKLWDEAEKFARDEELKMGVQMHRLSDADIAEIKRRIAPRIEEAIAVLEKAGKPARKFYAEYTK